MARTNKTWGEAKREISENPGGVLENIVSDQEVDELCLFLNHVWRERIFSPLVTLWTFLSQVLDADSSCRQAVVKTLAYLGFTRGLSASHDPSAYCRARKRLPEGLLPSLTHLVAGKLEAKAGEKDLWRGHRLRVVDGSSVTMWDTPENQKVYPQVGGQKRGCGFPTARITGIFSLITGSLMDLAIGPLSIGETVLFHRIRDCLKSGDILLGDRYYCSYAEIAQLLRMGVYILFRLHQNRKLNFKKARKLGPGDYIFEWRKGVRPQWMSLEEFRSLPDILVVRVVQVICQIPGWRAKKIWIVTTLLDPKAYPAKEIGDLYERRWQVEVNLDHLKTSMKMEFLSCHSPDMIEKELWAYLLAYNLIRTLMWDAGCRRRISPLRLSLKGAIQEVMALWPYSAIARKNVDLARFYDSLLRGIASHKVPNRPNRNEPRVRKRRPKNYRLMTKPRDQYKKDLTPQEA
jgi:hypothetical protein